MLADACCHVTQQYVSSVLLPPTPTDPEAEEDEATKNSKVLLKVRLITND